MTSGSLTGSPIFMSSASKCTEYRNDKQYTFNACASAYVESKRKHCWGLPHFQ